MASAHPADRERTTYRFEIAYDMDGGAHRDTGWDVFVFGRDSSTWRAVWRTLVASA